MLILNKGINQLYVTVSEKCTINYADYHLIVKDETTKEIKRIKVVDTSMFAIRYNQFQVELVNDILLEDLPNGIVFLLEGKHTYSIEASQASPPLTEICEVGMLTVLHDGALPGQAYTDNATPVVYTSYTGGIDQNIL